MVDGIKSVPVRFVIFCLTFFSLAPSPVSAESQVWGTPIYHPAPEKGYGGFGVGLYYFSDDRPIGFYLNGTIPTSSIEPRSGYTQGEYDTYEGVYSKYYIYNVGVTKLLMNGFIGLYAGGGFGFLKAYDAYRTTSTSVIASAIYGSSSDPDTFVENESESKSGLNINIGGQFSFKGVGDLIPAFALGAEYNTFPGNISYTLGIGGQF